MASTIAHRQGVQCIRSAYHLPWRNAGPCLLVFRSHSVVSMNGTRGLLRERVNAALMEMYNTNYYQHDIDISQYDGIVFPTPKPEKFGDYQCNVCMPLAKRLKVKPREIAEHLIGHLHLGDMVAETSVAGPGFLNFRISESFVKTRLEQIISDSTGRSGIASTSTPKRQVVDYSSPNIAKEMHVGHLRSTIIGHSLSKILEFLGHEVLRVNHVGDWGTQFGMLIEYMRVEHPEIIKRQRQKGGKLDTRLEDLVSFYKKARVKFDTDESFRNESRNRVVQLQKQATASRQSSHSDCGGDGTLAVWKEICAISRQEFNETYELLGIENLAERGESFYNFMLPEVVQLCLDRDLASKSDGAVCIFSCDGEDQGDSPPLIIQKSDGGHLYATTDLAALLHRVSVEGAERLVYVTDLSQAEHFRKVFAAARFLGVGAEGEKGLQMAERMASICGQEGSRGSGCGGGPAREVEMVHVGFGLVLGEDGKKLQSRAGESVKLRDLLEVAVQRARYELETRQRERAEQQQQQSPERELSSEEISAAAEAIGLGAVKYADLSMNREGTYKFSFDKMLSMNGNTAPYLLYVYARIRGIQRHGRSESGDSSQDGVELKLGTPAELQLAKHLIRFEEVLLEVERTLLPSKLCEYLYDLSIRFNAFYESCSVLHADTASLRKSRLHICSATADTLKRGLDLLGLDTVDKL